VLEDSSIIPSPNQRMGPREFEAALQVLEDSGTIPAPHLRMGPQEFEAALQVLEDSSTTSTPYYQRLRPRELESQFVYQSEGSTSQSTNLAHTTSAASLGPDERVDIRVHKLSGKSVCLSVEHSRAISALKQELAHLVGISYRDQELILQDDDGNVVLDDSRHVHDYCSHEDKVLTLTVTNISVKRICSDLRYEPRRIKALREISASDLKGDDAIIDAVRSCMEDSGDIQRYTCIKDTVNLEAISALVHLTIQVDERILSSVAACLDSEFPEVQQAAAKAFDGMASTDCALGVRILRNYLVHARADVRCIAGTVLRQMAVVSGADDVATAVCSELQQSQELLDALVHIALPGNNSAAFAICEHLTNDGPDLRAAALKALVQLVDEHNQGIVMAAIGKSFEDDSAFVRSAALDAVTALRQGSQKMDHVQRCRAIVLVSTCLADEDEDVRCKAVEVLKDLVENGDYGVIGMLSDSLHDVNQGVVTASLQLMSDICEKGDQKTIAMIANCLHHEGLDVRLLAVEALAKVCRRGDQGIVCKIASCIENGHTDLRLPGITVLMQICCKGDERVTAAVATCLNAESATVRTTAVQGLAQICRKGDQRRIAAVTTRLADEEAEV